jgi:cysteine desulfurase
VAAAVGLATALRLVHDERERAVSETAARRERLERALGAVDGVEVTALNARRLPGHCHVTVEGVASDELLFLLDQAGVCASAASSCSSGAAVASHVLAAMGMDPQRARGALRLTFGAETTDEDVAAVTQAFTHSVATLRTGG